MCRALVVAFLQLPDSLPHRSSTSKIECPHCLVPVVYSKIHEHLASCIVNDPSINQDDTKPLDGSSTTIVLSDTNDDQPREIKSEPQRSSNTATSRLPNECYHLLSDRQLKALLKNVGLVAPSPARKVRMSRSHSLSRAINI